MADYLSKFSGEEIDSLLDKIKDFNVINEIPSKSITDDKIADLSITTSLLSNGSVTMTKLNDDVKEKIEKNRLQGIDNKNEIDKNSIAIQTNQNLSLFNSDRLNLLEAQINADKNTIEYTSDKSVEITCNGANIIDCNAHFKKVEGQTGRYSPNIYIMPNNSYTDTSDRYTVKSETKTGIFTLTTKTFTGNVSIYFDINWMPTVGEHTTIANVTDTQFNLEMRKVEDGNSDWLAVKPHDVVVVDTTKHNAIRLYIQLNDDSANQNKTFILKPMVLKGAYTTDTIPPFQPYDNTLVNSKANFVSTGRNLYSGVGNDGHVGFDIYRGSIPKGTYYLLFKAKTTNQPYDIRVFYGGDNFKTLSYSHTAETNVYTIPVKEGATRIYFNSWNKDYQMSNIMLVVDQNNTYEPYIKNISQYDVELGAFDYIENGNLIKQTSEMITLNGSENWSKADDSNNIFIMNNFGAPNNHRKAIINSTNWSYKPYETWLGDSQGFDVQMYNNKQIRIDFNCDHIGIKKLEQWKAYLKANPITLVYQKATPTITPIVVPNGIVSYKNGLTSQEIKGKYLPYKYTAKYVNGGQQ